MGPTRGSHPRGGADTSLQIARAVLAERLARSRARQRPQPLPRPRTVSSAVPPREPRSKPISPALSTQHQSISGSVGRPRARGRAEPLPGPRVSTRSSRASSVRSGPISAQHRPTSRYNASIRISDLAHARNTPHYKAIRRFREQPVYAEWDGRASRWNPLPKTRRGRLIGNSSQVAPLMGNVGSDFPRSAAAEASDGCGSVSFLRAQRDPVLYAPRCSSELSQFVTLCITRLGHSPFRSDR